MSRHFIIQYCISLWHPIEFSRVYGVRVEVRRLSFLLFYGLNTPFQDVHILTLNIADS